MGKEYDSSWDADEGGEEAFDLKMEEWAKRDWAMWFDRNLSFPFRAKREEDDDDAFFMGGAQKKPFRLGHEMDVLGVEFSDETDAGFLVRVREGGHEGAVPLADIEVTPKSDRNFWPVREYAVWFANRM